MRVVVLLVVAFAGIIFLAVMIAVLVFVIRKLTKKN